MRFVEFYHDTDGDVVFRFFCLHWTWYKRGVIFHFTRECR